VSEPGDLLAGDDYNGAQAFADDDDERIVGLYMRWDLAKRQPPSDVLRVWARESRYELRHSAVLRAALADTERIRF
jgi:hypothetical protein